MVAGSANNSEYALFFSYRIGVSFMYMLNNVELKTASWGTSHSIFLNVVLKSPIFIQKFLSLEFDIELDNLVI